MTTTLSTSHIRCILLGAGGHARVLVDALRAAGGVELAGVLDSGVQTPGTSVLGVPVLGGDELLDGMKARGVSTFVVSVGSVGDASVRRRLFELGRQRGLKPLTVRHPAAVVSNAARVAEGCQLLASCIVNVGSVLGENVIINSGAIVEHDCEIGAHAHVASGAVLAGGVRVGTGAHIGVGATVRQGISIGAGAIVGAGAAVVKDVAAQTMVVGVPARNIERKAN